MKDITKTNLEASNSSGVRANVVYGNPLDQKRYMFALPYIKNKTVLDCASGIGWGSFLMASAGAKSVIGVELSKQAVESALHYYRHDNVRYVNSALESINLAPSSFDTIVSFETLEHVQDPLGFLKTLNTLLRPDGVMLLSTPNGYAFNEHDKLPCNPYHIKEYSKSELLDYFESSGWRVVEYRGQYPMARCSEDIRQYRRFIRSYWIPFTAPKLFRFPLRVMGFLHRKLGYGTIEPAFSSSCDPILISHDEEPAYHFFVLSRVE